MKIAYVSPMTIPSRSADSIQIMKACSSLAAQGSDVTLYIPYRKEQNHNVQDVYAYYDCDNNFDIVWQKILLLPEKAAIFLIAFRLIFSKADIVLSRSVPAALVCAFFGKRVYLELHEPMDRSKALKTMSDLLVRLPGFKGIITNCDALKVHTLNSYPQLRGKIAAIQNGAKEPQPIEPVTLKPEGAVHIGYAGQLYKGKGVEIVGALAPRFPSIQFHVVGGMPEDIEYWKHELKGISNITFHGFVEPGVLQSYLAAFDVLLAPYQKVIHGYRAKNNLAAWTSPMKVFDYMTAGKAIICSDLPFAHEILDHNENALLCPPDDVDAWARAVEQLTNSKDSTRRFGQAAQDKLLREYTWNKRAQKVLKFVA